MLWMKVVERNIWVKFYTKQELFTLLFSFQSLVGNGGKIVLMPSEHKIKNKINYVFESNISAAIFYTFHYKSNKVKTLSSG